MSSIANMSVLLSLDAAKFNAGLKSAVSSAKAFVGMLGVGLTVSSFVSTIRELENIGDSAAAAGVSVREFMLATGEMNAEDTQATTMALNKMGKALAEISAGGKEKAKDLQGLGLDLQGEGTYNALRKVAQAYTDTQDPVKKLAIAYGVFGKAATEVIPILDKLAAQSGKIGGKFAGMGPETIALAEAQEKRITALENRLKSGKNQFVMGAAGAVEDVAWIMGGQQGESPLARDKRFMKEAVGKEFADTALLKEAQRAAAREAKAKPFKDAMEEMDKHDTDELNKNRLKDIHASVQGRYKAGLEAFQAQVKRDGGEFDNDPEQNRIRDRMDDYLKESIKLKQLDEIKERFLSPPKRATWLEIFKDTRTPLEMFKSKMKEMTVLSSFAGAPKAMTDRAIGQAFLDLEKGLPNFAGVTARGMQRGSSEAGSFMANFEQMRESQPRNTQERVAGVLEIIKQIEAKQEALLRDIANSVKKPGMAMAPGL